MLGKMVYHVITHHNDLRYPGRQNGIKLVVMVQFELNLPVLLLSHRFMPLT